MSNAVFAKTVIVDSAKIGRNLDLSGSTVRDFSLIDLSGSRVHGDFILGPPPITWEGEARLILLNTQVRVLQDSPDAWPDFLELDGFTYDRLGGFVGSPVECFTLESVVINAYEREISSFKKWLEKQERYSPQPYEQLAAVFRKAGHKDKADDLLYTAKNRELLEAAGSFNRLGLFLLKVFIGYGYRIHYALYWCFGFVAVGVIVLRVSGQGRAHGMPFGVAYSLDMLLPIIRLRERHYVLDLTGWVRYYFYFHKLMGYVLGSFLIAGLSGLTK